MDKFLEMYNFSRLNQEKKENMNRSITCNLKNSQQIKVQDRAPW